MVDLMFLSRSTCVGEYHFNWVFTYNSLLQLLLKGKADKYVLNDKDIDVKWVNDLSEKAH